MTRTNRERKVLADPEPIDNFPPVLPLFFYFCLGLFGLLGLLGRQRVGVGGQQAAANGQHAANDVRRRRGRKPPREREHIGRREGPPARRQAPIGNESVRGGKRSHPATLSYESDTTWLQNTQLPGIVLLP